MLKTLFYTISEHILFIPFAGMFIASVLLTIKSRFVQIRVIPRMIKMIIAPQKRDPKNAIQAISPRSALLVSLSTAVGIGNILGPIMAIGLGGPGALAGFIVATIFGSAVGFVEVFLAVKYRKKRADGSYSGGPMPYINEILGVSFSNLYAYSCGLMLLAWSATQSNQLAVLLKTSGIPLSLTGILLAVGTTFVLVGGIKRLGALCNKLVPIMFVIYCAATMWVIALNFSSLPATFGIMFSSLFSPVGVLGIGMGYGMQKAVRWGIARAVQAYETGLGTLAFPHSEATDTNPYDQGILAVATTYGNGVICLLTGLTIMVSGAWLQPDAIFDIRMFNGIMADYFPQFGPIILRFCVLLFSFGTIVGNSYSGSRCFIHIANQKRIWTYYIATALAVFLGCMLNIKLLVIVTDYMMVLVAIPHMIAIVALAFKKGIISFDRNHSSTTTRIISVERNSNE